MKKLRVVQKVPDDTITVSDIDLRKHLVVYDEEEILFRENGKYVFRNPSNGEVGVDHGSIHSVFNTHGQSLTVYER